MFEIFFWEVYYWDNGKEYGNYSNGCIGSINGLYWDNGTEMETTIMGIQKENGI